MGTAPSTFSPSRQTKKNLQKRETDLVHLMMPLYFNDKPLSPEERTLAHNTWNLVINNRASGFISRRASEKDFPHDSSVTFFYDSFYTRLFEVHPMCKRLFKSGMKSQGNFLVRMISLALSELDDPEKFDKILKRLTEVHYERGVKAMEYGLVGEVLFWVMRTVLGSEIYNREVHIAWVKVYNRMIRVMVPLAVALEFHGGPSTSHKERFTDYEVHMFSAACGNLSLISDNNNDSSSSYSYSHFTNNYGTCSAGFIGGSSSKSNNDPMTVTERQYEQSHRKSVRMKPSSSSNTNTNTNTNTAVNKVKQEELSHPTKRIFPEETSPRKDAVTVSTTVTVSTVNTVKEKDTDVVTPPINNSKEEINLYSNSVSDFTSPSLDASSISSLLHTSSFSNSEEGAMGMGMGMGMVLGDRDYFASSGNKYGRRRSRSADPDPAEPANNFSVVAFASPRNHNSNSSSNNRRIYPSDSVVTMSEKTNFEMEGFHHQQATTHCPHHNNHRERDRAFNPINELE